MLSLIIPVRSAFHVVYPDLRPLRRAVKAQRWEVVSGYFDGLTPGADATTAVTMVAETRGVGKWLQLMVDRRRDDPLPRLLLGAHLITVGWRVRSGLRAQYVGREQFALFHEYLYRADRLLSDVTADQPGNPTAWTFRLDTARGLGFGLPEARRRYAKVAENCVTPFSAQRKMVQQLCPKWGGDFRSVRAFTRECLAQTPNGGICGAVVAEGHLEAAFDDKVDLVRSGEVRQDLRDASARILHPDFRPQHGWVAAHGLLAASFVTVGDNDAARPHFAAVGNRYAPYPWYMIDFSAGAAFRRARYAALGR